MGVLWGIVEVGVGGLVGWGWGEGGAQKVRDAHWGERVADDADEVRFSRAACEVCRRITDVAVMIELYRGQKNIFCTGERCLVFIYHPGPSADGSVKAAALRLRVRTRSVPVAGTI